MNILDRIATIEERISTIERFLLAQHNDNVELEKKLTDMLQHLGEISGK